jgi:hypothetical protein
MIDPVTGLAIATSAWKIIRQGFAAGREVESMAKDVSRWMGACHDIEKAHGKAKSRRFGGSVEEEALETWAALKKVKQQREELRLYMLAINPQAWNELVRLEGQIRKQRIAEEAERRRRREEIFTWAAIVAGISVFMIVVVLILSRIFP